MQQQMQLTIFTLMPRDSSSQRDRTAFLVRHVVCKPNVFFGLFVASFFAQEQGSLYSGTYDTGTTSFVGELPLGVSYLVGGTGRTG